MIRMARGSRNRVRAPIIAALAVQVIIPADMPTLASDLRQDMTLVYASGGQDQPAWLIVSVEVGAALKEHADCARLRIRRRPDEVEPADSRLCVERQILYGWDADRAAWLPQRPVGPNMDLTIPRANGRSEHYVTGSIGVDVIGARRLRVVDTTLTTMDAEGKAVRRLRERYALSLATATGGRFETPDPERPGQWRTQQIFELREIR
jgi:hypothetical protein